METKHYANCNSYNADFDGDEMNVHFPQSIAARAEALHIAGTSHNYCGVKSGMPLVSDLRDGLGCVMCGPCGLCVAGIDV